ncbi:MAG: hypothetical protein LBL30_02100 [Holosporales bacterium]|nr:hypothetical protein [Holosporales bacterium]
MDDLISDRWNKFVLSITKYAEYPRNYVHFCSEGRRHNIWEDKTAKAYCLRDFLPFLPKGVMLFISSPMNTPSLFHLPAMTLANEMQNTSMISVFLDWGEEGYKNDYDFSEYIENILMPAYAAVSNRFGLPVYLMGHHLGSIAACSLSVLLTNEDRPAGTVLMSMPWDFRDYTHTEQNALDQILIAYILQKLEGEEQFSFLLQILLNCFYPGRMLKKICDFASEPDQDKKELFVQIFDWLCDTRRLPKKLVMQFVLDWFRQNSILKKEFYVCGQLLDPRRIMNSVLLINPLRDRVVPYASSKKFVRQLRDCSLLSPDTGFFGIFTDEKANEMFANGFKSWIMKTGI